MPPVPRASTVSLFAIFPTIPATGTGTGAAMALKAMARVRRVMMVLLNMMKVVFGKGCFWFDFFLVWCGGLEGVYTAR